MPEPEIICSTAFLLKPGKEVGMHPHDVVVREEFDGTTTTGYEIATVFHDPHRGQYSAQMGTGRTPYVSDPRIAFDDAVQQWLNHESVVVQTVYKTAAAAWKTLQAEEEREQRRNAERRDDGKGPFPATRRNLLKAQYGWYAAQNMLAQVLCAIGADARGHGDAPSGDRAWAFLEKWMERNPNE